MNLNKIFYVYEHVCKNTGGSFYVGKGKNNRAYSTHRSEYWKNFVNKHGDYSVNFLVKNIDEELSFLVEQEVIDLYRRKGFKLVNITAGGEGFAGVPAWNKNKPLSESHKKSISFSHLGRSWTEKQRKGQLKLETVEKRKQKTKAQWSDNDMRAKMSKAISNSLKGIPHSDDHKKANSIAVKAWWAKRKGVGNVCVA